MIDREQPIAVFDSGVGGISVLKEMVKLMPHENFLYYGDSLNAPYGTKSTEEVRRLTIEHTENFLDRGAKAVAIACNTATSAAVRVLRQMYPELPLVGIEPALKPAVLHKDQAKVLVLATPMTIREEKFQHLLNQYKDQGTIYPLACPGLMEYVERGEMDSPKLYEFLQELLEDYIGKVDSVVLGCTHYPFTKRSIQRILGDEVEIFDGGYGTAREMKRRIQEAGLLNEDPDYTGKITFENSELSQKKLDLCWKLLNY